MKQAPDIAADQAHASKYCPVRPTGKQPHAVPPNPMVSAAFYCLISIAQVERYYMVIFNHPTKPRTQVVVKFGKVVKPPEGLP